MSIVQSCVDGTNHNNLISKNRGATNNIETVLRNINNEIKSAEGVKKNNLITNGIIYIYGIESNHYHSNNNIHKNTEPQFE